MSRSLIWAALLLFAMSAGLLAPAPATAATTVLTGRRIVLDIGHGGSDTGTAECATLIEKEATLQIGRILEAMLSAEGAIVTMTRTSDVELSNRQRSDIANAAGGEALISIHLNGSSDHSINRTLGLWGKRNKDLAFARTIHARQLAMLGVPNEGVRQFASRVLLSSNMPAMISESVYLSNTQECERLTAGAQALLGDPSGAGTRQREIAAALHAGLTDWFTTR